MEQLLKVLFAAFQNHSDDLSGLITKSQYCLPIDLTHRHKDVVAHEVILIALFLLCQVLLLVKCGKLTHFKRMLGKRY
jgi:hypothetical protein